MNSVIDSSVYPNIDRLIALGYADSLDAILSERKWVMVCDEGGQVIAFDKRGMDRKQILDKLERYAEELMENGLTNDEINGVRQRIW